MTENICLFSDIKIKRFRITDSPPASKVHAALMLVLSVYSEVVGQPYTFLSCTSEENSTFKLALKKEKPTF
jgi:hypothetical protein